MKRFILAALAAAGWALPAAAQAPAPDYHRNGFYVGLTAGKAATDWKAEGYQFGAASLVGGAFVGYQHRLDGLIVGIEGDYMFTALKSSSDVAGFQVTGSNHFLASIRGRVGIPLGAAQVYATAGPAFSEKATAIQLGPFVSSAKDVLVGVAYGAGLETEISRSMSLRIEGLQYAFPNQTADGALGSYTSKDQTTVVRAGVSFRLN